MAYNQPFDANVVHPGRETEFGILPSSTTLHGKSTTTNTTTTRLQFPDQIYERDDELNRLYSVYKSVCQESSNKDQPNHNREGANLVMISGRAGIGKSALVNQFAQRIAIDAEREDNDIKSCYFLTGKYDEIQGGELFSALVEAFNQLCDQIDELDIDEQNQMTKEIKAAVGNEAKVLTEIVPGLLRVFGERKEVVASNPNKEFDWNRLRYVFKKFVQAICSRCRPLVLFLDDLQWADTASLDLVTDLVTDRSLQNFMFVGAFRSYHFEQDNPLVVLLSTIQENKRMDLIELKELSDMAIGRFIADTLRLDIQKTQPLAEALYKQTQGNIFFVMQSLEELLRKQILYISETTNTWAWDIDRIDLSSSCMSDDVVEVVTSRISTLPEKLQKALSFASFMRSTFEVNTLLAMLLSEGYSISLTELVRLLETAVLAGFLHNSTGSENYKFAHDRIKQASYSLLSSHEDGDSVRIRLAECLIDRSKSSEGEDWMLFVAVDHLNTIPNNNKSPLEIVQLNLQVGEKAMQVSAFVPASIYLRKGLEALAQIETPWKDYYDMTLRLFRASADVELCLGNFDVGTTYCCVIIDNALTSYDKLRVTLSLGESLGRRNRHAEAMEVHFNALYEIREFPRRMQTFHVVRSFRQVRRLLKKYSDFGVLLLPIMTDKNKLLAMDHLTRLSLRAYRCNKMIMVLLCILRQIVLSFKHGVCPDTAQALAAYGMLLCGTFGDQDGGSRMGRLAHQLIEGMNTRDRTKYKNMECRVLATTSINIDSWAQPITGILDTLQLASHLGMESGDLEYGYLSWAASNSIAYVSGFPLPSIDESGTQLMAQMKYYKVTSILSMYEGFRLVVSTLMGTSTTPFDWKKFSVIPIPEDANSDFTVLWTYWSILQMAYYFGELEVGFEIIQPFRKIAAIDSSYAVQSIRVFFSGLIACALAGKTGNAMYKRLARKLTLEMQNIMRKRGLNNLHRCQIMQAALAACESPTKPGIRESFDSAISTARKAGFVQDAALCNELAGEHLLKIKDTDSAKHYFSQAKMLYEEWGAVAKVECLVRKYGDLCEASTESSFAADIEKPHSGSLVYNHQSMDLVSGTPMRDFTLSFEGGNGHIEDREIFSDAHSESHVSSISSRSGFSKQPRASLSAVAMILEQDEDSR